MDTLTKSESICPPKVTTLKKARIICPSQVLIPQLNLVTKNPYDFDADNTSIQHQGTRMILGRTSYFCGASFCPSRGIFSYSNESISIFFCIAFNSSSKSIFFFIRRKLPLLGPSRESPLVSSIISHSCSSRAIATSRLPWCRWERPKDPRTVKTMRGNPILRNGLVLPTLL